MIVSFFPSDSAAKIALVPEWLAIAAPVRHERIRPMVALGWVIGYRPPWVSRTWAGAGLRKAGGLAARAGCAG